MWQNRSDPLAALLAALFQATESKSRAATLRRFLLRPFKKTSLELEIEHVGKLTAEAEFHAGGALTTERLQRLPELLDAVIAASKDGC